MSIDDMKYAISTAYNTKSWKNKVENMCSNQIIAVYYDLMRRGLLYGDFCEKTPKKESENSKKEPEYEQLSIFDFIE